MGVSENRGTPKSSILIGFSIINHPFWGTTIFGNIHIVIPPNFFGKQNKGIKTSKVAAAATWNPSQSLTLPWGKTPTLVHWGPQTNSRHHLRASHRVSQDASDHYDDLTILGLGIPQA